MYNYCFKNKNFALDNSITSCSYLSVEERTTLPNESVESNESNPVEHVGETNIAIEEGTEHPEENVDKNEEKSDNQEKEE